MSFSFTHLILWGQQASLTLHKHRDRESNSRQSFETFWFMYFKGYLDSRLRKQLFHEGHVLRLHSRK